MSVTTAENKSNLIGLLNLLLVIALGISLAKLVWLILTPKPQSFTPVQQNSEMAVAEKKSINYGKLIADQHIFGEIVIEKTEPIVEPKKPDEVVKETPKIKLNAKLFGIIAYEAHNTGYALISNNGGSQKVYSAGDELQEGVTISQIFPQKVVIDNHGVAEDLLLPVKVLDNKSGELGSNTSSKTSSSNHSLLNNTSSLPTGSGLSSKKFDALGTPDLAKLRQDILLNPNKLTEVIKPSPATRNGEFLGFRVRSGSNRRLFNQLKFRNNDIITEINGIVLDSANKGVEVFSQFETASSLSIKLLRRNEEVYIEHSF